MQGGDKGTRVDHPPTHPPQTTSFYSDAARQNGGKRRQFKTIASFPQLAGPGTLQASPAAARTDPEEGRAKPPLHARAPRDPCPSAEPSQRASQIPWRPLRGTGRGFGSSPAR